MAKQSVPHVHKFKLLAVDDHQAILDSIRLILGDAVEFTGVVSPDFALELLQQETFDIVISDYNLKSETNGISIFKQAQRRNPFVTACLMTADDSSSLLKQVFLAFGGLFIEKPFCEGSFLPVLESARRNRARRIEITGDKSDGNDLMKDLVAETPSMIRLHETIQSVAPHETLSVHLTGPTGTGKSTLVEVMHKLSLVKGKLITVNCAGLEELAMSRLFGHTKGAFTGAIKDHEGYVKQADGGTLFLDELHLLPKEVQGKLLRVLQDGIYQRLGDTVERSSKFRLITAASVNVRELAEQGQFIPDLWYRISGKILTVPSLSERKACIPRIVYKQLEKISEKTHRKYEIKGDAMDVLVSFSWDGNIRDLCNCLHSICSDSDSSGVLTVEMVRDDLSKRAGRFGDEHSGLLKGESLDQACRNYELTLIRKALRANSNNIARSARDLGVPRGTLRGRMEKLGLNT